MKKIFARDKRSSLFHDKEFFLTKMLVRVSPCAHKTDLVASHYVFPEQRKLFQGHWKVFPDDKAIKLFKAVSCVFEGFIIDAPYSFQVGDMISVIDMPPPDESIWWRGKRGFEVGFFPCECVEVPTTICNVCPSSPTSTTTRQSKLERWYLARFFRALKSPNLGLHINDLLL